MSKRMVKSIESDIMTISNVVIDEPLAIKGRIDASQLGHGTPHARNNIRPFVDYRTLDINIASEAYKCIPSGNDESWNENGITVEYMGKGKYCVYGTAEKDTEIFIDMEPFVIPAGQERLLELKNSSSDPNVFLFFYNDKKRMDYWKIYPVDRKDVYSEGAGKRVNRFSVFVPYGVNVDCVFEPVFTKGKRTKNIKMPEIIGDFYCCDFEIDSNGQGKVSIDMDVAKPEWYGGAYYTEGYLTMYSPTSIPGIYLCSTEPKSHPFQGPLRYEPNGNGAIACSDFKCGTVPNVENIGSERLSEEELDEAFSAYDMVISNKITYHSSVGTLKFYEFRALNPKSEDTPHTSWFDHHPLEILYLLNQPVQFTIITDPIFGYEGSNCVWVDCGEIRSIDYPVYVEDQSDMMKEHMYTDLVTDGNRKPRYMEYLKMILGQVVDMEMFLKRFPRYYDLKYAEGAQLDALGAIVGASRELDILISGSDGVLSDIDYRLLIRSKIARAHWDGTNEGMFEILTTVFNGFGVVVKEYETADATGVNMALKYVITGILTDIQRAMIEAGMLFPVPPGVHATYTFPTTISDTNITMVTGLNELGNVDIAEVAGTEE